MQIIRKSNFDHEDWRGNQRVVASGIIHSREAMVMCDALNRASGPHGEDFYETVPDDYKLPPPWEP
jgi:hypothetical protein